MPALNFSPAECLWPTAVWSSALLQVVATDTAVRMSGTRCQFQQAPGPLVGVRP